MLPKSATPVIVRMCRNFDSPDVRARCPICSEFVEVTTCDGIEPCAHLGFAYLNACSEFAYISPEAEADIDQIFESGQVAVTSASIAMLPNYLTAPERQLVVGLECCGQWQFLNMADQYSTILFGFRESPFPVWGQGAK